MHKFIVANEITVLVTVAKDNTEDSSTNLMNTVCLVTLFQIKSINQSIFGVSAPNIRFNSSA